MSATDRLKALENSEMRGVWEGGILLPVMPQIVAVVEAAEQHVGTSGAHYASRKHAALREALSGLDDAIASFTDTSPPE